MSCAQKMANLEKGAVMSITYYKQYLNLAIKYQLWNLY